jgi:hypothetical protein
VLLPLTPDWIELRPGAMPPPIDRRIRLARHLVADDLPEFAPKWADDVVRRAANVLGGVQPEDEVIKAAVALRTGPLVDRGEVEARLLTFQAPADIAAATGLPFAVIDVYAKLFFDLTGNTGARSWMLHEGIGSKAYCGLTPEDIDSILKMIGFRYGLGFLEPVVRYYRRGLHRVPDLDAVADIDAEERAWARSIRGLVAVHTLKDPHEILRLRAAFPETMPEPAASPGLRYRLTLDMAAEAVVRAAEVARSTPPRAEPPVTNSPEPAKTSPPRRPTPALRRTGTRGRRTAVGVLVPAGA